MTDHNKEIDAHSGTETTGHEWDGIKELNTPLPRWWLYIWYATILWSIVYWVFMPAWPGLPGAEGNTPGLRNHSDRALVAEAVDELRSERSAKAQILLGATLEEIETDNDLGQFAREMGESVFGDNCATCHGAGGRGFKGYPALGDDVWLWGGTLDDIQHTITYGIRSAHDETRYSEMPAYGKLGFLTQDEINDLTQYVLNLSGQESDQAAVTRAQPVFERECTACHGVDGTGDRMVGAPNLTDSEWLYGSTPAEITNTIYNARNSVMPAWNERMDEATIKAVAVYVHSLGGGE